MANSRTETAITDALVARVRERVPNATILRDVPAGGKRRIDLVIATVNSCWFVEIKAWTEPVQLASPDGTLDLLGTVSRKVVPDPIAQARSLFSPFVDVRNRLAHNHSNDDTVPRPPNDIVLRFVVVVPDDCDVLGVKRNTPIKVLTASDFVNGLGDRSGPPRFSHEQLDRWLRKVSVDVGDTQKPNQQNPFFLASTLPATGTHYVEREAEMAQTLELVETGKSVLITAPRRFGKTSFLKALARTLADRGTKTHFVDLMNLPATTPKASITDVPAVSDSLLEGTVLLIDEADALSFCKDWVMELRARFIETGPGSLVLASSPHISDAAQAALNRIRRVELGPFNIQDLEKLYHPLQIQSEELRIVISAAHDELESTVFFEFAV